MSLLSGWSERNGSIATALYAIWKSRLLDLLSLEIDVGVKRDLIAKMSQKEVDGLSDEIILKDLNNKDDQVRKIFALKCAQAMSRTRVRKLLDTYVNGDSQRYYNSVHWLDLGASMSRQAVKKVTKFQLEKH